MPSLSARLQPNGTYVMHAIEYGLCEAPTGQGCDQTPDHCGFRDNHNVSIWTTPDLSSGYVWQVGALPKAHGVSLLECLPFRRSWEFQGYAFPYTARPAGLIFRPEAIFNPREAAPPPRILPWPPPTMLSRCTTDTSLWVLTYNQASGGSASPARCPLDSERHGLTHLPCPSPPLHNRHVHHVRVTVSFRPLL